MILFWILICLYFSTFKENCKVFHCHSKLAEPSQFGANPKWGPNNEIDSYNMHSNIWMRILLKKKHIWMRRIVVSLYELVWFFHKLASCEYLAFYKLPLLENSLTFYELHFKFPKIYFHFIIFWHLKNEID